MDDDIKDENRTIAQCFDFSIENRILADTGTAADAIAKNGGTQTASRHCNRAMGDFGSTISGGIEQN